jgi:methyltransferase (TIGR00027 family)
MSKSRSAYGVGMIRAMEAFVSKEERIFEDPLILQLLPRMNRLAMRRAWMRGIFASMVDWKTPGVRGSILCRTRCIDDAVQDAFRRGFRAFRILGAGFDTRAYRLPELRRSRVLEIELPKVQGVKRTRLAQGGIDTSNVRFISLDFDTVPLESALIKEGLPADEPVYFVWEGVTQYLSPKGVGAVLDFVGNMPTGSEIIFRYVLDEVVTKQYLPGRTDEFRRAASYQPESWHFGIDPARLPAFLKEHRLVLTFDVGADWHLANYVYSRGRNLPVSEIERIAQATV